MPVNASLPHADGDLVWLQMCASQVASDLGPGHRESPYSRALSLAMGDNGASDVQCEVPVPIIMKTHNDACVGYCKADIIYKYGTGYGIVEVKISDCSSCRQTYLAQARKYLRLLSLTKAYIVMFGLKGATVYDAS